MSPKTKAGVAIGGVVAVAVGAFFLLGGRNAPVVGGVIDAIDPPPPVCPLSGIEPAKESVLARPAVAVKITNSSVAYPLRGLQDAEIVYEELVEGGLTRFLAMYHCTDAGEAGPIRSARSVDPAIMTPTTYILAFSGANAQVFDKLDEAGIVQIEENVAGDAMQRIETGNSFEYTLFADTAAVRKLARDDYNEPPPDDVYEFGELEGTYKRARIVRLSFSHASQVGYEYKNGKYLRFQDGQAFMGDDGNQIAVDNVLLEIHAVNFSQDKDVAGASSTEIADVTGSGKAVLFRDGRIIRGTWSRESLEAPVRFTTKEGDPMVLAPGSTWIHLLPNAKGELKGSFTFEK
ncbi:MAG TPA: DUF3048 domain-containing protein [Actinomycetota bacterium]|nr:DUF3048 domain-containing protein [Actinomycetota bacterium]